MRLKILIFVKEQALVITERFYIVLDLGEGN